MKLGLNQWEIQQDVDMRLMESLPRDAQQEWWEANLDLPAEVFRVDYVIFDKRSGMYDNNGYKDYSMMLANPMSEMAILELRLAAYRTFEAQRVRYLESENAELLRAAFLAYNKGQGPLANSGSVRAHMYCDGWLPETKQVVDLTSMPGGEVDKAELRNNVGGNHNWMGAWVKIPKESAVLDFVFSDESQNAWDNNNMQDFHTAVSDALSEQELAQQMAQAASQRDEAKEKEGEERAAKRAIKKAYVRVVHVAVEMAPIAKVGGMGDVVTALGRAVQEEGHTVEVIIPKYDCIRYEQVEDLWLESSFAFGGTQCGVLAQLVAATNIESPAGGRFQKFEFHCGSALHYLNTYNVQAHIVHCHDWQSAHIAWGNRGNSRCVFTIHNLSYGADLVGRAMGACDVATTVSPTYAQEISGQGPIAPHLSKLYGIRNGIDADIWDPEDDPFLPMNYSYENCIQGKTAAREELRRRLNLANVDVPVVGCVTRLVAQKAEFNALRDQLMQQFHGRAALIFTYDEPLSHVIYAGCDMFLVPSMFEPCGLTQMIAMQFGTVPVVRRTGGLADTVYDVDHDEERAAAAGMRTNGFMFDSTDAAGMDYALNRAISMFYNDRPGWNAIVARIMQQDWSWYSPALDYTELYYKALRS
ncbi:hypothetical protein DUNSADRAFT_4925 [Dunaliella salina]|uniref:starch synthase n=1 Tax=Dunaliella salina TaxID=3046 RepID=A0ABQ7GR18_DUNSA|nr:hypothetical protein DUNSADRAFT_4925 [Dunaliella salina]|eukprot:KAF5837045.1 hypothetical protein DUNSADRAFT_4925 [Dunaliella salina]